MRTLRTLTVSVAAALVFALCVAPVSGAANRVTSGVGLGARLLRQGMRGTDVRSLQELLRKAGLAVGPLDGLFGRKTRQAVVELQKRCGLVPDGIVGKHTLEALVSASSPAPDKATPAGGLSSRGDRTSSLLVRWEEASLVFRVGDVAILTDTDTRLSLKVKRTGGRDHADCEPLAAADTAVLRRMYGGRWSWERRGVIVEVRGRRMPASINGMPHGHDTIVNGFPGHICVHFVGSRLHTNGNTDPEHQAAIRKAAAALSSLPLR